MKKTAIPKLPRAGEDRTRFDAALKERAEILAGERGGKIAPLAEDADMPTVVAKINELIALLQ